MSLDSLSTGKSPIQSAKIDIIPVPESLNPSELDNVHLRAPTYPEVAQGGLIFEEKSVTCVWPLPYNKGKVQWGES
ncbi:hypothetical protein N7530_008748 [Penicillium desertorum]|uniref:Uncharacterized protein n=1 Tax=Penicillium desertorum TaxID=1303715 RepID=A0A9W9WPN7_9EURO|nr:hypothetical protein N7530_008748 [Penicillium desertorum]